MASDLTVARTIVEQLGGRQFMIMTGVKDFLGSPNGVSFRIPPCDYVKDGINYCRIELSPMDTYIVEFGRVWGKSVKRIARFEDIYAENLQDTFTETTGLLTRLGRAR